MTKNVELHLHKWSKMKGALGSVTETGSGGGFSGGSYSSWGGPAMSSYSGIGGSNSQGFANRIKSLVEITEKAKRAINELDVDGAIGNLHFHDDHVTAITLQSKLTALENYAGKVQEYLKDKIDQPFYEKLDKVGDRLEALNIASYKTSNQIGFKKTEVIYSEAGQYMGTREVLAKEVGLKELYQIDNPYKTSLQAQYEAYKSSDAYKESQLSEEDYLFASHQTRAFTYHSLNDEKAAFEGARDLALGVGVVILSIFCPPAGAVAGVALAAADMYSAASGKDWMTGRELDDGERLMRGAFALFDLVPGVGYLNDLAKTGKVGGFAGIKASLKTSFKEGMEQAAKNVDNFKVVLKNVDDFGKRVVAKIDDFGKQLDNLVTNKVSSLADNVAGKLRHADETISTAAQNFRLNIGLEPQLIDGFMPTPPPGKLSGLADNIQAFAKNLSGSVSEVANSRRLLKESKVTSDDLFRYLDNIDAKAAQEFRNTGKWPTDQQIPKDPSVLTLEGKIDWSQTPENGFVLDEAGKAIKEDYIPKVGEVFDRYGPDSGRFTSPVIDGKPFTYDQRSLPYLEDASKYHQYEVIGDFSKIQDYVDNLSDIALREKLYDDVAVYYGGDWNKVVAQSGDIAASFGATGGGIQWQMPFTVDELQRLGLVKEIL
ncbi:glycohydrolase toxin TNT-related protein [Streptococcus fryi]